MDRQRRLDAMDERIIALFERRMAIVKKQADEINSRQLKKQRRHRGAQAADKTVRHACDVDVIAYTESLVDLMLLAAQQYQKTLLRIKQRKKRRGLFF